MTFSFLQWKFAIPEKMFFLYWIMMHNSFHSLQSEQMTALSQINLIYILDFS